MARYLITSALPYINGMKHLANLVGSLLPADIYARFLRAEGEEVLFICATDDHGTPAEIAAQEQGLDVREYCRVQHERQYEVYRCFGLSFDHFGRTSSPQNRELTQYFYRKLDEHGLIEERQVEQIYSARDRRFLPDRYVIGTCPVCGYEGARGDQCEKCTTLLDPASLIHPRSALSGSADLQLRPTKHLFFKLEPLAGKLRQWVESHPEWPLLTRSIALKWLDEGVRARGITRDLTWGVPVPRAGFEDKVFYVWFDALIGYIAATKEWSDLQPGERDWRSWWYDASDVQYVQFLAKDNVPFHTIFFPATILGTGEPWTLASYIKAFNWLTYYGGKFSTSQRRGVFMDQALEHFPADVWRYYLIAQAPESDDADFTWEHFAATVNKDLANTFGNFVHRTLVLTAKHFGHRIPAGGAPGPAERQLQDECRRVLTAYRTYLGALEFRKAAAALRELWTLGNVYLDRQAPWSLVKEDPNAAALVLRTAVNLIRLDALASEPILPFTAHALCDALRLAPEERTIGRGGYPGLADQLDLLEAGRPFDIPGPLFQRVDETTVAELRER